VLKIPPEHQAANRQVQAQDDRQLDQKLTETEDENANAPNQKAGFRVPKTVLWLIKH
jgi:hypothetical protein